MKNCALDDLFLISWLMYAVAVHGGVQVDERVLRVHIPSMGALRAFVASARHLSFTRAAEELGLTQSAVSREILKLEAQLGRTLFHRVRKRLSMTEDGVHFLSDVSAGLRQIELAVGHITSSIPRRHIVNLALPTSLGTWMMPQFTDFLDAYPNLHLNYLARNTPFELEREGADAAIYCSDEVTWQGLRTHLLLKEEVVAVCHPSLTEGVNGLRTPEDLQRFNLLQVASRSRDWSNWLKKVGISSVNGLRGPRYELFTFAVKAAVARAGVALVPQILVVDELKKGELCEPFDFRVQSGRSYYFVIPESKAAMPILRDMCIWLSNLLSVRAQSVPSRKSIAYHDKLKSSLESL